MRAIPTFANRMSHWEIKERQLIMKSKENWINWALFNLVIVALLGVVLRSKMLFSLKIINFSNLLNAHSHFALGSWVTLALMILMVYDILPSPLNQKRIYKWLFCGVLFTSWATLFSFSFEGSGFLSTTFSTLFILVTYVFSWIFILDIRQTPVSKPVLVLSLFSIICLVLSSIGTFSLDFLFSIHSLQAILYRDALFTYLHLQYNGFFALAVFALLFHKIESKRISMTASAKKNIHRFSILLCLSILPSLFLSFLWQDPHILLRIIAISGSFLVLLTLTWFVITVRSLAREFKTLNAPIRYLLFLSMTAFSLKMFLQMFTVLPVIGNAVFGDRPMIIGFLHLVFLGFVTLFLLAYFVQENLLDSKDIFTRAALIIFSAGVVFNEVMLMGQGLGAMFLKSSQTVTWLLWFASIWLFIGAVCIAVARFKHQAAFNDPD